MRRVADAIQSLPVANENTSRRPVLHPAQTKTAACAAHWRTESPDYDQQSTQVVAQVHTILPARYRSPARMRALPRQRDRAIVATAEIHLQRPAQPKTADSVKDQGLD